MTRHAQQEHRRAGECRPAVQAAGLIKAERLLVAAQLDNETAEGTGGSGLLGHPQHILRARGGGLEQQAGTEAGERSNARQVRLTGLGRGFTARQPQQRCGDFRRNGPAHQGECKAGKAGGMAGLRRTQFGECRPFHPAAKRDIESCHAGADEAVADLRRRQCVAQGETGHGSGTRRPAGGIRSMRIGGRGAAFTQLLCQAAFDAGNLLAQKDKPFPPRRTAVPGFHDVFHVFQPDFAKACPPARIGGGKDRDFVFLLCSHRFQS